MEKSSDGANIRFPPPLIYVLGLVFGVAFAVAGFLVSFAGAGIFLRRRTAIIPFKPATALVTSGIYRRTRNPMYLGMALIYAGLAVLLNSLPSLVLLPLVIAIVHSQVIAREEAYLERAFGNEYVAYKGQVRPWI